MCARAGGHTNRSLRFRARGCRRVDGAARLARSAPVAASAPKSSKVLLLTILNPVYNITCDILHQIMSPYGRAAQSLAASERVTRGRGTAVAGNVQRIVIFMKNGVQAMVEFDNEASAAAGSFGRHWRRRRRRTRDAVAARRRNDAVVDALL